MAIKKVMYVVYFADYETANRLMGRLRSLKLWWKLYTRYYGDNSSEPVHVTMEEDRE